MGWDNAIVGRDEFEAMRFDAGLAAKEGPD